MIDWMDKIEDRELESSLLHSHYLMAITASMDDIFELLSHEGNECARE